MKKLGRELNKLAQGAAEGKDKEMVLKMRRAMQVQTMFQEAIESIYGNRAPYVLEHINAVYVMGDPKTLHLYVNDASFRTDLINQQFLIQLYFKDHFGEEIVSFKTYPSRFSMKERHPYQALTGDNGRSQERPPRVPLSREEFDAAVLESRSIENPDVRKAFLAASLSSREREKREQGENRL